jgi:hypothetical protein
VYSKFSVEELHHFYAAPGKNFDAATCKNFDAAPAPAPTQLYSKAKILLKFNHMLKLSFSFDIELFILLKI